MEVAFQPDVDQERGVIYYLIGLNLIFFSFPRLFAHYTTVCKGPYKALDPFMDECLITDMLSSEKYHMS